MLAVGIDIGGTKIAVGLVDDSGAIHAQRETALSGLPDFPTAIACIAALVADVSATADDHPVMGIGVGAPGPLDRHSGFIDDPHTLSVLCGRSLTTALQDACGLAVVLENDVDAALLGEAWIGAASGCSHAGMITLGTGIGGAILSRGQLLRGVGGAHPEFGHIPVSDAGAACYCGQSGCFESLASGSAIAVAGHRIGFNSAAAVFTAAENAHVAARAIIDAAVRACCRALWTLIHAHHPEVVVWGGGVMAAHYHRWFASELERTSRSASLVSSHPVMVRAATLGVNAGLVGAASMVLHRCAGQRAGFQVRICQSHEELSQRAAAEISGLLARRPDAVLCLPTGGTPTRMYELLADRHRRNHCAAKVRVVKLDEWGGLPAEHPGTCEAYLRRHVLEPLEVASERYLGFATDAVDATAECARIQARLMSLPPIDLCILGLGINGHLALIEPGEELTAGPHVANLSISSRYHPMLQGADPVGLHGLTLGMADILQSRRILLLVSGAEKADIFRRLRDGRISTALPASLLLAHSDVICLCDSAAWG